MRTGRRYKGLTLRVLGKGGAAALGPGKAELVERIGRSGSISAAAREMGMSYRRAWQLVESLNRSFREPVVATATGGRRGGGARVTAFGARLVAQFRKMEDKASAAISTDLRRLSAQLRRPR
ncbi:MAG TPA: LysR family transcriptional regulator [Burkholderiales bacterium]|jgi:molybdate transport system regulatory protein|nr:LysR family transcriptional regulator [Burkholderiales bacterium]